MTAIWTIVAILAPWTLGVGACRLSRLRWGAAIALGWFVGQAVVMFGAYAVMAIRNADDTRIAATVMFAVGAAAILVDQRTRASIKRGRLVPPTTSWTWLERLLLVVLIISIAAKGAAGAASLAWNPGRCEDALAYWLFKAKVVTAFGYIPPDVNHPFYLGGSNPKYPIYPSMIAAWIPLVVGEWRESLSVIPWLVTFISLPAAAALAVPRGTPRLNRLIAAYMVGSLPLAVIHVYRPGYVDLLLASFLVCGLGLLLRWIDESRLALLGLAMLLLAAAACTKREGMVAVAFVLSILVLFALMRHGVSWQRKAILPAAGGVTAIAVFLLMDRSDLAANASHWAYHPEAWAALWRHAFEWSSFSFFFPLALAAALGLLIVHRGPNAYLAVCLCIAMFAYAASPFVLTENIRFALNDQTPSRLLLHIAPAMVVALAHGTKRGVACRVALS